MKKKKGIPLNLQMFAEDSETEEEKKYTDEEVNEIIKKKFAKWKKDQDEEIIEPATTPSVDESNRSEYSANMSMSDRHSVGTSPKKFRLIIRQHYIMMLWVTD